jgi:hypothetical protein
MLMLITPAIASEPYWAEAPSLNTSIFDSKSGVQVGTYSSSTRWSIDVYQRMYDVVFHLIKLKLDQVLNLLIVQGQCDLFHQLQWLYLKWTMVLCSEFDLNLLVHLAMKFLHADHINWYSRLCYCSRMPREPSITTSWSNSPLSAKVTLLCFL